jgi:hypothetical protein
MHDHDCCQDDTPMRRHGFIMTIDQLHGGPQACIECGQGKEAPIHRMKETYDPRMPDEGEEECEVTVDDDDGDAIAKCRFRKGHDGKCGF